MATTPKGIPLYDDGTPLDNLDSLLNGHANALDAALTAQDSIINGLEDGAHFFTGTAAERVSFKPDASEGDTWKDTDGSKLIYSMDSGEWRPYPGLEHDVRSFSSTTGQGGNSAPGGILFRSGSIQALTSPAGVIQVSFTKAFPVACIAAFPMSTQNTTHECHLVEGSLTKNGFQLFFPGAASVTRRKNWLAIGF